ncbi:hypothetical protein [Actinophytocola sp.]|uniref:hypothetical protein n=1 Tax=Actinophytocola sp. TaxID=1872138 RepID=UPI00389A1611
MSTAAKRRKRAGASSRKKARTDAGTANATDTALQPATDTGTTTPPRPLVGAQTPAPPATVTGPRPVNPFAGKVKALRGNFGTEYHDAAHFRASTEEANHGVWQGSLPQVRNWVGLALHRIYSDDRFVAASEPGTNGSYRFLIDMDGATVGYLGGVLAGPGQRPARHIEVYLGRKGDTVSAFPSSPDSF